MICEWCKQDIGAASTCTANLPFEIDGKSYTPVTAEQDCLCGVRAGGFHHLGCESEICPCCGDQRLYCNCANPNCKVCDTKMAYVGADDERACYECPACGAEQ